MLVSANIENHAIVADDTCGTECSFDFSGVTLATDFYVNRGWTAFVSYLAGTTDGIILGLVYFSHVKRIFEKPKDDY